METLGKTYTKERYIEDTKKHISLVQNYLVMFAVELMKRAVHHDQTKLEDPEMDIFAKYTPELNQCTYSTIEYEEHLKKVNVALEHHYMNNSYHPQHYKDGIRGMDLLDVVEMFFDWKAASMSHTGGDIKKSIRVNKDRFNYSDDLECIFMNTVESFKGKTIEGEVTQANVAR